MSNALSVFEKHLGKAQNFSISTSINITDINQVIGALQTIDKHLKKILVELSSEEINQDLISHCFFMGENLFDKEIFIAPIKQSFHIHSIANILTNNTHTEVSDFIHEKREEISSLLESIFAFLDSDQEDHASPTQMQYSSTLQGFY